MTENNCLGDWGQGKGIKYNGRLHVSDDVWSLLEVGWVRSGHWGLVIEDSSGTLSPVLLLSQVNLQQSLQRKENNTTLEKEPSTTKSHNGEIREK